MKPILILIVYVLLSVSIGFVSCKKETSCEGCNDNKNNKPPIAVAGPDRVITLPIDSVLLDGSTSSDPDGMISEWLWTKISGPVSLNILKPADSVTKVKVLVVGTYLFELKVTDNGGLSAKDTMRIIVDSVFRTNHPPIANAGTDQTFNLPTNAVNLDGSASTDPENNITSYVWTKISGPTSFNIVNSNAVQTQVTNLVQGTYQFELKVTDAGGLFSKDSMFVTVNIVQTDPCVAGRPIINAQLVPFGTLSEPKSGAAIGAAGNKIVFAGGGDGSVSVSTVDIYDIVTNAWSTAQLSTPRSGMAVTTCGNKIFFAGGSYDDSWGVYLRKNVDIYDASTNTWSVDSLSSARNGLTAASVGNKVFFAGGTTPNYSFVYSNTVDIYDLTTNTWSITTLSEARGCLSAVTIDNKIYFAGGENGYQTLSNRIDIYDNATSSWSVGTLNEPKARMSSIAFDDKIYWAGGINFYTPFWHQSNQVEIRDVNTQTSSFACLFQPNMWYPYGVAEKNGKLVFFMGYGNSGVINKFDIYDVATNTWSIGVLNQNLHSASIISVNNTIYVAGGVTAVNAGSWSNQVWKLEF